MMKEIIIMMIEAMGQMIDRDLQINIMTTIVMVVERRMIDTMMIIMVMIEIMLLR